MSQTKMIHIRLDEHTKAQASAALESMGLSMSEAVRMYLTRIASEQRIPFDIKVPNAKTRAAMEEARSLSNMRFDSADEIFDTLDR